MDEFVVVERPIGAEIFRNVHLEGYDPYRRYATFLDLTEAIEVTLWLNQKSREAQDFENKRWEAYAEETFQGSPYVAAVPTVSDRLTALGNVRRRLRRMK